MKLEVGKYYRTRDGHCVGPMVGLGSRLTYCFLDNRSGEQWAKDGTFRRMDESNPLDLIAEWQDEPSCEFGCDTVATKCCGDTCKHNPCSCDEDPVSAPPHYRAHILDTAKKYVTKDRQSTHGKPEDTFGLIASYWSSHLGVDITSVDVCAMMALLKLARAKSNPGNDDNWIDLAGYAACAGELSK